MWPQTQRTPNWATESLFIGEIIFMVVAFCVRSEVAAARWFACIARFHPFPVSCRWCSAWLWTWLVLASHASGACRVFACNPCSWYAPCSSCDGCMVMWRGVVAHYPMYACRALQLPGCITLVTVNSLMSYDIVRVRLRVRGHGCVVSHRTLLLCQWRPALSLHYALIFFTKVLLVCPLLIRFVHLVRVSCEPCCGRGLHAVTIALPQTGAAAKLTGHNSRDASRVRSVRFYWMNRYVVLPASWCDCTPELVVDCIGDDVL